MEKRKGEGLITSLSHKTNCFLSEHYKEVRQEGPGQRRGGNHSDLWVGGRTSPRSRAETRSEGGGEVDSESSPLLLSPPRVQPAQHLLTISAWIRSGGRYPLRLRRHIRVGLFPSPTPRTSPQLFSPPLPLSEEVLDLLLPLLLLSSRSVFFSQAERVVERRAKKTTERERESAHRPDGSGAAARMCGVSLSEAGDFIWLNLYIIITSCRQETITPCQSVYVFIYIVFKQILNGRTSILV